MRKKRSNFFRRKRSRISDEQVIQITIKVKDEEKVITYKRTTTTKITYKFL
jgi:hypothetical protein